MVDYLKSSVASSASSVRSWISSSSSSAALPSSSSAYIKATKSSRASSSRSSTSSSSRGSSSGKSHAHRHGGLSCSTLQHEWQTTHPVYLAIKNGDNVNSYLSTLRLDRQLHHLLGDLSELVPPSASMPSLHKTEPDVKDYVQLPCHIWAPDFFYPHLVPYMPCSTPDCNGRATRQRWNPNGPRLVHGVHSAVYVRCWQYKCVMCDITFAGWDDSVLQKLPPTVRVCFRYVLTHRLAVTTELHRRIIDARVHGGSLQQLQKELNRNRHSRMHETIVAYYRHCEHYKLSRLIGKKGGSSLVAHWSSHSHGAPITFPMLLPELQPSAMTLARDDGAGHYYFDHPAPSVRFMGALQQEHARAMVPYWNRHTQQLTADRVCIDATFKVPKKLIDGSLTRLWSMMDVDTGCLLHQQMLTHEAHEDVLPMLSSYRQRCIELRRPPPSRVCSDRGLMDARVLRDSEAFPNAHITVDPWHFNMRFAKTLNKSGAGVVGSSNSNSNSNSSNSRPLWRDVHNQFNRAMYKDITNSKTGLADRMHAEPEDIITAISALIQTYAHRGTHPVAVITKTTQDWWTKQIKDIRESRILSNPYPNTPDAGRMSSSMLENYHRQLNRLVKVVRFSESAMRAFLAEFMFRWNTDRRRQHKLEHDWVIYDLRLLHSSYESCVRVMSHDVASEYWPGGAYRLPEPLLLREEFGLDHPHVTQDARMQLASGRYPFSDELIEQIVDHYLEHCADLVLPKGVLDDQAAESTDGGEGDREGDGDCDSSSTSSLQPDDDNDANDSALQLKPELREPTPGKVLPVARRMNAMEEKLLTSVIAKDALIRDGIDKQHWNVVAGRWNSVVQAVMAHPQTRTVWRGLHSAHGETIRRAVDSVQCKVNNKIEHQLIAKQASAIGVDSKPLQAKDVPFTQHENDTLKRLVRKHNTHNKTDRSGNHGKKLIRWTELAHDWHYQYLAETEKQLGTHLWPRALSGLKSHWQTLKTQLDAEAENARQAAAAPPSATATIATSERELMSNPLFDMSSPSSSSFSSFSSVSSSSSSFVDVQARAPAPAPTTVAASAIDVRPPLSAVFSPITTNTTTTTTGTAKMTSAAAAVAVTVGAPGIRESPTKRFTGQLLNVMSSVSSVAARSLTPLFGTTDSSVVSNSMHVESDLSSTLLALPFPPPQPLSTAAAAPAEAPAIKKVAAKSTASYHWTPEESQFYLELREKHNGKLPFKEFERAWPSYFAHKDAQQFYSHNRSIKNALTRASVKMNNNNNDNHSENNNNSNSNSSSSSSKKVVKGKAKGSRADAATQQTITMFANASGTPTPAPTGKRQSLQTEKGREYQVQMQQSKRQRLQSID